MTQYLDTIQPELMNITRLFGISDSAWDAGLEGLTRKKALTDGSSSLASSASEISQLSSARVVVSMVTRP